MLLLMLLPLAPPIQRDPSALDVSFTVKTFVLTASPAPHVHTLFLSLVPTVLAS